MQRTYKVNDFVLVVFMFILAIFMVSCSYTNSYNSGNIDYKKAALLNVELGRNYLSQGSTERAKKKFLHALKLMPNLADSHSGMGYFWETVGEVQEAEKHYKRSIYLGKGSGVFYNQYAVFLCDQGRYNKAEKYFMLAVKDRFYTKTAEVYANAGLCALRSKDDQKAVKYFTKSLDHDPNKIELLLELTRLAIAKKEIELAKSYLDQFYNKNSKPTALYLLLKIKLAKISGQEDQVASDALLLKNLFADSIEYGLYKKEYDNI